jgi:hypothetical protein
MPEPRIFTLEEAERALPLVRRIVEDIVVTYPAWREEIARYEMLAGAARADEGETGELIAVRDAASERARAINDFLLELERIGCLFKGFDAGLVDFYSLREDRLVLLCWRRGEERITHWHELDAGLAGRQPIDELSFATTDSSHPR